MLTLLLGPVVHEFYCRSSNRIPALALATCKNYVDNILRHDLGSMDIICKNCGALHWNAEKIMKSMCDNALFGMCYNHGEVDLPVLPNPPELLQTLLTEENSQGSEFREHIQQYNTALAFTSLGVHQYHYSTRGPPVFTILGELCHRAGSLIAPKGVTPSYAQLYVFDLMLANTYRSIRNTNLQPNLLMALENMLRGHHYYAPLYTNVYHFLQENPHVPDVCLTLIQDPTGNHHHNNLPAMDKIAAIIPGDSTVSGDSYNIVLHLCAGGLQQISNSYPAYTPLQYVLLFPFGTNG
jgi:hypothetical protein